MHPVKSTSLAAGALLVALLTGCASLQPKSPEQVVAERAQQRWSLVQKRDFAAAWDYTQPGFRAIVSRDEYPKRFGSAIHWKSTELQNVTCAPERCTVTFRVTSSVVAPQFRGAPDVSTVATEEWIRDDGQWWFYQAL